MTRLWFVGLFLVACGDDGNKTPDAAATPVAIQSEIIDWDSDHGAAFCGVYQAVITQHDVATNTAKSAPNGRITLMVPDATGGLLDVTPPTAESQCALGVHYALPGTMVLNKDVLDSGKLQSYRLIGTDRLPAWFTGLGLTYDPAKAMVFVHVEGTAKAVKSTAAHDAPAANTGTTWSAGDTGENVVFPNTAPGTSMIDFTAGGATGAMSVPATAGAITYVTLIGA